MKTRTMCLSVAFILLSLSGGRAQVPQRLAPIKPGRFSSWIDNTSYFSLLQFGFVEVDELPGKENASPLSESVYLLTNDITNQLTGHKREVWVSSLKVSPDHKWVMATLCNSMVGVDSIHLKSVTGQYEAFETNNKESNPIWTSDSHHLIDATFHIGGTEVNWYTPGSPMKTVEVKDLRIRYNSKTGFDSDLLGISKRGTGIVAHWLRRSTSNIEVYEVDISSGKNKTIKTDVHPPKGRRVDELCYNPKGDRLAMVCYAPDTHPTINSSELKSSAIEIWTCLTDGSHMNCVLKVPIARLDRDRSAGSSAPEDIAWMPDGDSISYIMDRSLWRLAVH